MLHHQLRFSPLMLPVSSLWISMIAVQSVSALEAYSSRLFTGTITVEVEMIIRDCSVADLMPVSDLMVQSFYNNPSTVSRYHYRIAEYSRLQESFPSRDKHMHRMLVAALSGSQQIIGFCHLDNRPASPSAFITQDPRPMLSDLLVCPSMLRKGIGKKLLEVSEAIALGEYYSQALYLRVLVSNEPARAMYTNLGYNIVQNRGEPPQSLLLQKKLTGL